MSIINKFITPDLKTRLLGKLKPFFAKNREKIILTLGVIVITIIGFCLGRYSIKTHPNNLGDLKGEINVPVKNEIKKQKEEMQKNVDEATSDDINEEGIEEAKEDAVSEIDEE